jgi:hypothetical protein
MGVTELVIVLAVVCIVSLVCMAAVAASVTGRAADRQDKLVDSLDDALERITDYALGSTEGGGQVLLNRANERAAEAELERVRRSPRGYVPVPPKQDEPDIRVSMNGTDEIL